MLSPAEHKRVRYLGRASVAAELATMMRSATTVEAAESFAAGMIEGVRDFLIAYGSERAAYDALQAAADATNAHRTVSPETPT